METRNIKDFIHLYLGCEVLFERYGSWHTAILDTTLLQNFYKGEVRIKPFLRPLSSMTKEEKTQLLVFFDDLDSLFIINERHFEIKHDILRECRYDSLIKADKDDKYRLGPSAYWMLTPWLLKQGFDLFNLIPAGLAVDGSKLK